MQTSITISAPGKLHLLGEHSVVYGQPAIIAAVNKRCSVSIRHPELACLASKRDSGSSRQDKYINTCIQESFSLFKKTPPQDFSLSVTSNIPPGAGMGSSAAIAVSVAGYVSYFLYKKIDKQKINEIAYTCEKYIHGNPSGGDNTASTYGGIIWYQKKNKEKTIDPLSISLSKKIPSQFLIINTGRPYETTGEMVNFVAQNMRKNEKKMTKIFNEQGNLVIKLLDALKNTDIKNIKEIIQKGEKNLEAIGVVSESSKKIIRTIENIGGTAKICGAGGIKGPTGILLVMYEDMQAIDRIAKTFGYICEKIALGEEGVRLEKVTS